MNIERSGGFANIEGLKFGTVKVLSFAGRNPAPRWNVVCDVCSSRWTELHSKLTQGAYHCKNVACTLGRVQAPRAKQIEPEIEKPVPIPVPAPVSDEYRRYREQMRLWGMDKDTGSSTDFEMLSFEQKGRIMAPVIEAERQREIEAFAASIEAQERERMRRQYGI